ncbi:MAG: type I DNA topoisomerase [Deltaproteobacteria bacterium]|nr:type I DNA topoisomerase [Deltaproteobacteria bacterium]
MSDSLIIVESPTKVKTIKKFLGPDFDVRACMGHVKDLPKSTLGIDMQHDFEPTYQVIETKKKIIAELKKAAKSAKNIYLAPDPDREGEAIAWHIAGELAAKGKLIRRVLFNDLTKNTILDAISHPLDLNFNKYEAQQTRRILDRLVGYQISPLLWEKVKRGLSAGRVQSVAVRIICDREAEICKFVPEEYWNLTASLEGSNPPPFEARLTKIDGKKAKVVNETQSSELVAKLKVAPYTVAKVEKKEMKRSPAPPFTTSKLQQEASRKLSFSAKKTMGVAQKLYEGIELGKEGSVGLITYMRTDSVRIAEEALKDARTYIRENYDPDYLPAKSRVFKNAGTAQDAHEAIRPSSMAYKPQDIKAYLNNDQFRLYQLIWNRFMASQMNPAVFDQTTIDITAGGCTFRAQGSVMTFPGFTIVYTEGKEDNGNGNGEEGEFGRILPALKENETLKLLALKPEQKFTQPAPRFTEASLVRELEENGIGRPSTYAAILSTIQDREYVRLEKGRFHPTDLGVMVTDLLILNFPQVLDVAFTASLENKLDMIEEGKIKRLDTLNDFYIPFAAELKKAKTEMRNVKREELPTDKVCEKCGHPMVIKWGRNGNFLACSNYPTCKNTQNFTRNTDGQLVTPEPQAAETDIVCDKCSRPMVVKGGKFGPFLGCSGYPECKNIVNMRKDEHGAIIPVKEEISDVACDQCGRHMVVKRGRFGPFLGCSGYPECKNIMKTKKGPGGAAQPQEAEVTDTPCDKCGRHMVIKRGRFGRFLGCSGYPECKNIMKIKAPV